MPTPVLASTVYASEAVPNDQTIPQAPEAPQVITAVSGAQSQRFERVMITQTNLYGESAPSPEVIIQVPANSVIVVSQIEKKFASGDYPGKPYGFSVYATTGASNSETKQNTTLITSGQVWQEPAAGLIAGAALPTAVAPTPDTVANAGVSNTPPATGAITVAQSPLGVINTNTGRTAEATSTYMSTSLNALNVGTTPPPTGLLPH